MWCKIMLFLSVIMRLGKGINHVLEPSFLSSNSMILTGSHENTSVLVIEFGAVFRKYVCP